MNSYQLTPEKWQKENNTIQQILINNGYNNKLWESYSSTIKTEASYEQNAMGKVHSYR